MRKTLRMIRKVAIALIGFPILIIGLILIPAPGPGGIPVTLLGLIILSLEFDWARRRAQAIKDMFKAVIEKAKAESAKKH